MALLHSQLDVLRIMIASTDDDQVFQTSCNKQLTFLNKTQVAGSQERPFAAALQNCFENLFGFFRTTPIPCGNTWPFYPDFPDLSAGTFEKGCWINNDRFHPVGGTPGAGQRSSFRIIRKCGLNSIMFERLCLHMAVHRPGTFLSPGNLQCRFRQPISRIKCAPAKAAWSKLFCKLLYRSGMDRFRAVVNNFPTAQIQPVTLIWRNLCGTQLVSKIGPSRVRYPVPRDCIQPAERLLQKSRWRHEIAGNSRIERLDNSVNQSHVMEMRKPAQRNTFWSMRKPFRYVRGVVQHVGVRDHHSSGGSSRARCVLQVGQVIFCEEEFPPVICKDGFQSICRNPTQFFKFGRMSPEAMKTGQDHSCGQCNTRLAVFSNGSQTNSIAVHARRIRRNCDHTCIEAAYKSSSKLQSWRIEQ